MKKTFIPLIYDCNDNCISCPVPRKQNRQNPSFEHLRKEIDKILKISKHIEINGGEPTLRRDIFKILKYIEKKNPEEIGLLTNVQTFYYEKYAKKIAQIKNLKIITTLYGSDSRIHDAITRTPGSFTLKIAGIRNLIKNKAHIELRILIHKMNYKHFEDVADFLINNFKKTDFDKIVIMNPKLTERAERNKKMVAEKLTILSKILENPIKKLDDFGYDVRLYHFPHCVLPKSLWEYSQGLTSEDTEVNFTDDCKECQKKQECSRIWKSYLVLFGSNEFKPIKKRQTNLKERIKQINNNFYHDKLYFLLGLKPVLRLELDKNGTFLETIQGLENFEYCQYKDYIFISENLEKAKLAKQLTRIQKEKSVSNEKENQKIEILLGRLYGYPHCCAKNFLKINTKDPKKEKEMAIKTGFYYKNKKLYMHYYPCSKNCEKTKRLRSLIKSKLNKEGIIPR